jgi:hypothetical protein
VAVLAFVFVTAEVPLPKKFWNADVEKVPATKNVQVKKTHLDQYALESQTGGMLFLFNLVIGLVEL